MKKETRQSLGVQLIFRLDAELKKQIKLQAVMENKSMNLLLEEAITDYLNKRPVS